MRQTTYSLMCCMLTIVLGSCLEPPERNIVGTDEYDDDGDGFTELMGDCNDLDPEVFPGNEEICDGKDNDCDESTVDLIDGDFDGVFCDIDCDDSDPLMTPGREELCDGKDNDCDPLTQADVDEDGQSCSLE